MTSQVTDETDSGLNGIQRKVKRIRETSETIIMIQKKRELVLIPKFFQQIKNH